MKKLCALLRIKFFFQQDDTKIVNPLAPRRSVQHGLLLPGRCR